MQDLGYSTENQISADSMYIEDNTSLAILQIPNEYRTYEKAFVK